MSYKVSWGLYLKKCTINCRLRHLRLVCLALSVIFSGSGLWADSLTLQKNIVLCGACHGKNGISLNPAWPNLAGQHKAYTYKQLRDFKQGKTRSAPTMAAIVATLNEADMAALAAYYAALPEGENTCPAKYRKRGELLYRGGDLKKHISACIACHGPRGDGNQQAGFPLVRGQHALYVIAQLQAFKDKKRFNDYNSIMHDISTRMSTEDMTAVAYYIQGLY